MDYRHFQELLAGKATAQTSALQELLREYPYCQAGHLLLVKTLHAQQHIRYEPALRTAAAHQPDRRVLYRIVHEAAPVHPESVFHEAQAAVPESPFLETAQPDPPILVGEQPVPSSVAPGIFSDHYRPESDMPVAETETTLPVLVESREAITNPHIQEEPVQLTPVTAESLEDPREVLRRRLAELLGDTASAKEDAPQSPAIPVAEASPAPVQAAAEPVMEPPVQETPAAVESAPPESRADAEHIAAAEPEALEDPVFREELSVALEETLLHELERLPEIGAQSVESEPDRAAVTHESEPAATGGDFFAWLKTRQVAGFGQVEAVHAEDATAADQSAPAAAESALTAEKAPGEQAALIDKFIAEEPRIVPSKAEFYNPVVQAKRSVEEHEDVVSETLAGIYAAQGNLLKARTAYQRLGLLHPEKSTYFAALVREIDEKLNSSSSEDL